MLKMKFFKTIPLGGINWINKNGKKYVLDFFNWQGYDYIFYYKENDRVKQMVFNSIKDVNYWEKTGEIINGRVNDITDHFNRWINETIETDNILYSINKGINKNFNKQLK